MDKHINSPLSLLNAFLNNNKPQYPSTLYFLKDTTIDGKTYRAGRYTIESKGKEPDFTPLDKIDFNSD